MKTQKLQTLLALIACSSLTAHAAVILGPITNPSNGHSYLLLATSSWTDAEAEAISLGGHLATVRSSAENQWIIDTFTLSGSQNRRLWIGLNDAAIEGTFVWTSGEPVSFTYWASGEPNSLGNEDYTEIVQPVFNPNFPLLVPGSWNDSTGAAIDGNQPTIPYHGVVEIVPEPTTAGLLLFGLTTILIRRSRKPNERNVA